MYAYALGPVPGTVSAALAAHGFDVVPVTSVTAIPADAALTVIGDASEDAVAAARTHTPSSILACVGALGADPSRLARAGACDVIRAELAADDLDERCAIVAAGVARQQLWLGDLASAVSCILFRWCRSGDHVSFLDNAAFARTFDARSPARAGLPWRELFAAEHHAEVEQCVQAAHAGRPQTFVARVQIDESRGRWMRVELRMARDGLVGSMIDVSPEHELEALLSRSGREWRAILDSVPLAVILVDPHGRVGRLNARARELLGGDFRDVLGAPFESFAGWQPWATASPLVTRALAGQGPHEAETAPDANGRQWVVSVHLERTLASHGIHTVVLAQEITEQVRLRRDLAIHQQMASVGRVVAGVAHEVRNPLFGISAVVDALEGRLREANHELPHLAKLRTGVERLTRLMNELLALGTTSRLELEPAAVGDIVADARTACAALAAAQGVEVVISLPERPIALIGDRSQLVQLMQNLIDNAIRHAPRSTRVEVTARSVEPRRVQLTVRDHGPGFSAYRARAFEPFYARRRDGIGLGLAIVQQIALRHGGTVALDDAADGGAVVVLELPLGGGG